MWNFSFVYVMLFYDERNKSICNMNMQ